MRYIPHLLVNALLLIGVSVSATPIPQRYEKLQAVLEHLKIADERDYGAALNRLASAQTRQGFETILKYADPEGELQRYLRWDDETLTLYRDRDTRTVTDFSVPFLKNGAPKDVARLITAMRLAAQNPAQQPLNGLRIALDPGHMGGKHWDAKTGKFVQVGNVRVSEGEIALLTCLLLAQELTRLGADIIVTRHALAPVTDAPLETYDLAPSSATEIRSQTDSPWFEQLLASAPLGPQLLAATSRNRQIQKLKSEAMRDQYFISRVDLTARADKINAFRSHLTLVIHFDAEKTNSIQNASNAVRGYIPGNILQRETASREQRYHAVRTLLDGQRWLESAVFTAAVVKGISSATGVKIKTSPDDFKATRVSDGVYARNLALTRLIEQGIMAYIEVLNYDFHAEFRRLAVKNRHIIIDGVKIDYPARLDDIVTGIKQGILDYVRSMDGTAQDNAQRP